MPPRPTVPEKQPQTMTDAGCLTVLDVNLGSYLDASSGLLTRYPDDLKHLKVLSSLNITFIQSSAVQCLYFKANCTLLSFIFFVKTGFLAARLEGKPMSTKVRLTVRIETFERLWGKANLASAAVEKGLVEM